VRTLNQSNSVVFHKPSVPRISKVPLKIPPGMSAFGVLVETYVAPGHLFTCDNPVTENLIVVVIHSDVRLLGRLSYFAFLNSL